MISPGRLGGKEKRAQADPGMAAEGRPRPDDRFYVVRASEQTTKDSG